MGFLSQAQGATPVSEEEEHKTAEVARQPVGGRTKRLEKTGGVHFLKNERREKGKIRLEKRPTPKRRSWRINKKIHQARRKGGE